MTFFLPNCNPLVMSKPSLLRYYVQFFFYVIAHFSIISDFLKIYS